MSPFLPRHNCYVILIGDIIHQVGVLSSFPPLIRPLPPLPPPPYLALGPPFSWDPFFISKTSIPFVLGTSTSSITFKGTISVLKTTTPWSLRIHLLRHLRYRTKKDIEGNNQCPQRIFIPSMMWSHTLCPKDCQSLCQSLWHSLHHTYGHTLESLLHHLVALRPNYKGSYIL